MKEWEAKVLGFSAPWWLLVMPFIKAPLQQERAVLTLVALPVALVFAIIVSRGSKKGAVHLVADCFLLGIGSISVLFLGIVVLAALMSLGSAILSL